MEKVKPVCRLIGEDGNVFSIIGRVAKSLKLNGQRDLANEFTKKAFSAGSYDDVLQLAMDYVDVE